LLIGVEDSVTEDELKSILEAHDPELKAANDLKIREGANGVRTAIIRVPLAPGLRLMQHKRLKVGCSRCRIKELATAPHGCAKCSKPGHSVRDCNGTETKRCFRCKEVGHLIASCQVPPTNANLEDEKRQAIAA